MFELLIIFIVGCIIFALAWWVLKRIPNFPFFWIAQIILAVLFVIFLCWILLQLPGVMPSFGGRRFSSLI